MIGALITLLLDAVGAAAYGEITKGTAGKDAEAWSSKFKDVDEVVVCSLMVLLDNVFNVAGGHVM